MAYDSPLDQLADIPGSMGDAERYRLQNPPQPFEMPDDTDARLANDASVQQRVQTAVNRMKAGDLARRSIPAYDDPAGNVQPVTDQSGALVTNYQKGANVGWDSLGSPVQLRQQASGPPTVEDAYTGVQPETDPKTGDQYLKRAGMPWQWTGQDPDIAAANLAREQDRAVAAESSALRRKLTIAESQLQRDQVAFKHGEKQFATNYGPINYDDPAAAKAELEKSFNEQYAQPDANATKGWFDGALSDDAQTKRAAIDAQKDAAVRQQQALIAQKQDIDQRRAAADAVTAQRAALEQRRVDYATGKARSLIPGLEDAQPISDASEPTGQAIPQPAAAPAQQEQSSAVQSSAQPTAAPAAPTSPIPGLDAQKKSDDPVGPKPYLDDKGNFAISDTAPVAALTQAVQDGVLPNPPPEVWKAAQDKQALIDQAGSNPKIKAALAGAGRGAAFLATAPIGAGAGAALLSETGPGAAAGGLVGGFVTGSLGAYGYGKLVDALAKHNDTINSFVAAQKLHPGYSAAGELATFGAGLPQAGMKAIGALAGKGADALADSSSVIGQTADAVRATQAEMKAAAAAGQNVVGATRDTYSVASDLLSGIGKAYDSSGGGIVQTVEGLSDLAKGAATQAVKAGADPTIAATQKVAARVALAAGGMAAIDTIIKEGSKAIGLSDEHQTLGGLGFAALIGAFTSGHGISRVGYSDEQLADIMARGWAHDFNITPDTAKALGQPGEAAARMVEAGKKSPLTPEEQEIYSTVNQEAMRGVQEGRLSADPRTWQMKAEQILTAGRKTGVSSADVEPRDSGLKTAQGSTVEPPQGPAVGQPATPPEKSFKGRVVEPEPPSPPSSPADLTQQRADTAALLAQASREGNSVAAALHTAQLAKLDQQISKGRGTEAGAQPTPAESADAGMAPTASAPSIQPKEGVGAPFETTQRLSANPNSEAQTTSDQLAQSNTSTASDSTTVEPVGGPRAESPRPTKSSLSPSEQAAEDQRESSPVDTAAHEAATSPKNDLSEPTEKQKLAGNYKKGPVQFGPKGSKMDVSIENPAGSVRSGVDREGKSWSNEMKSHYGYIRGSKGKDGDHIDIFIKPGTPQDYSGPVYVVNQNNADGKFDEHKAIAGASSPEEARKLYLENYHAGQADRIGSIAHFGNFEAFKRWAHGASRRIAPAKSSPPAPPPAEPPKATIPGLEPSEPTKPAAPKDSPATAKLRSALVDVRSELQAAEDAQKAGYGDEDTADEIQSLQRREKALRDKLQQAESGGDSQQAVTSLKPHENRPTPSQPETQPTAAPQSSASPATQGGSSGDASSLPANAGTRPASAVDHSALKQRITDALQPHHDALTKLDHPLEVQYGKTNAESGIETDASTQRIRVDPEKVQTVMDGLGEAKGGEWLRRAMAHEVIHVATVKYANESPANRAKLLALTKDKDLMGKAAEAYGDEWKNISDFARAAEAARMLIEGPEELTEASYSLLKDFLSWLQQKLKKLDKGTREVVMAIRAKMGRYEAAKAKEKAVEKPAPKPKTERPPATGPPAKKAPAKSAPKPIIGSVDLQKAGDDFFDSLGAAKPKEIASGPVMRKYRELVDQSKFKLPAVSIGHLAQAAHLDPTDLKAYLVREWQQGRVVFSTGDWSNDVEAKGDEIARAGALELMGQRYLQVRFVDSTLGAAKPTDTPEFKRWFGDSKVVDKEGKPLVAYHGARNGEFSEFKKQFNYTGEGTEWFGPGFYFTTKASDAAPYAHLHGGGKVMDVYLSIKNPAIGVSSTKENILKTNNVKNPDGVFGYELDSEKDVPVELINKIKSGDFTLMDILPYVYGGTATPYEIVAHEPEQVKSATANSGAFNPKNPSMLGAAAPKGDSAPYDPAANKASIRFQPHQIEGANKLLASIVSENITTPEQLAQYLSGLRNADKAKPYTQALWNMMGGMHDYEGRPDRPDWQKVYKGVTPAAPEARATASAETPARPANSPEPVAARVGTSEGGEKASAEGGDQVAKLQAKAASRVIPSDEKVSPPSDGTFFDEALGETLPKGWRKMGDFYEYSSTWGGGGEFKPSEVAEVLGVAVTKRGMNQMTGFMGIMGHSAKNSVAKLKEAGMWGEKASALDSEAKPAGQASPADQIEKIAAGQKETKAAERLANAPDTSPAKLKVQKAFLLDALDKAIEQAQEAKFVVPADADLTTLEDNKHFKEGDTEATFQARYSEQVRPLLKKYGVSTKSGERTQHVERLRTAIEQAVGEQSPKIEIEVPGDGTFRIINTKSSIREFRDIAKKDFPTTGSRPESIAKAAPKAKEIPPIGKPKTPKDFVSIAGLAVSKDSSREVINYVLNDGAHLVGTDGRRALVLDTKLVGMKATEKEPILLDPKTLKEQTKDSKGDPLKFADWKRVIPDKLPNTIPKIDTGELAKMVMQARELAPEKASSFSVRLMLDAKGKIGITSQSPEIGEYVGGDADPETAKQIVALNADFLLDGLRAIRAMGFTKVDIKYDDDRSPIMLTAPGVRYVLMPMRLGAANPLLALRKKDTIGAANPTSSSTERVANLPKGQRDSGVDAKAAAAAFKSGAVANRVANAINATKAAAKVVGDYFTKLEPVDSYRKATGEWLGAGKDQTGTVNGRQVVAMEARNLHRQIVQRFPNKLSRMAVSRFIEADGDMAKLGAQAAASKPALRPVYERAQALTPEERQLAQEAKQFFEEIGAQGHALGILDDMLENYVTHFVDSSSIPSVQQGPAIAGVLSSAKLKTKFDQSMRRVMENMFELEQRGYRLASSDIAEVMAAYSQSFGNTVADRTHIKNLTTLDAPDGRPLTATSGYAKEADKTDASSPLLVKPRAKPHDANDYVSVNHPALRKWKWAAKTPEGKEVFVEGDLLVHPSIAQHLSNALGTSSLNKVPLVRGLTNLQYEAKGLMLGFSLFHYVQEGTHAIGHGVNPFKLYRLDTEDPVTRELMNGGLMLGMYDAKRAFSEGMASSSSLLSKIPGIGPINDELTGFLFEQYIPGLKAEMAKHAFARNLKRFAKELAAGTITREQVARKTAKQANDAFGEQNNMYEGNNPTRLHAERLGFLAPDFLKSRMHFFADAFRKYGGEQRRALIILAVTMMVSAKILERMVAGKNNWKKPFSIVTPHREYELRSVPGDVLELLQDPRRFISGRLSPLISRTTLEGVTGLDWRGRKRTFGEQLMDLIKTPIPISVRGFADKDAPELSPVEQLGGATGFRARRHSDITDARILGHKWQQAQGIENPDAVYPPSKYLGLRQALEDSNLTRARTAYAELLKGADKKKVDKGFAESLMKPFSGSDLREPKFIASLSPNDRQAYRAGAAERERVRKEFEQISNSHPAPAHRIPMFSGF